MCFLALHFQVCPKLYTWDVRCVLFLGDGAHASCTRTSHWQVPGAPQLLLPWFQRQL